MSEFSGWVGALLSELVIEWVLIELVLSEFLSELLSEFWVIWVVSDEILSD